MQAWTFEDATNNRITDTYTTAEGTTKATYSYPAGGPAHAPGAVSVDTVSGTADAALAGIEGTYTYSDAGELLDRPVAGDVQRLEWDAEHHLAGVDPADETAAAQTAVYDTAGARLLRRVTDPGAGTTTTVYLPGGVELVHDSTKDTGAGLQTGEVTPRRDYTFAGQLIATRTGMNPADVTTWSVDAQGTPEYALGNAETAAASAEDESLPRRRQRPFGADRGTAPDKATFPGERGFVGSTRDEGVDLLHVGARPYDPVLGLFVTTDPLVDPADPASLNAYAYAKQNPISYSDPSGLAAACIREGTCAASSKGTPQRKSDGTLDPDPFDNYTPPPPTPSQPKDPIETKNSTGDKGTGFGVPWLDELFEPLGNMFEESGTTPCWGSCHNGPFPTTADGKPDMDIIYAQAIAGVATDLVLICMLLGPTCGVIGLESIPGAEGASVGTGAGGLGALLLGPASTAKATVRTPQVIRAGDLKLAGVPKGATGVPVRSGKGLEYPIPRHTPELDPRVASIRVMDPVTSGKYQYPNGYVSYMNSGGQVVSPLTGKTLQPSDPLWHIPLP